MNFYKDKKLALPAKWDNIKNTISYAVEGTRGHDIHPKEDDFMIQNHHTHCSNCDKSFDITTHFYGDGIICKECTGKKYPYLE